MKICLLHCDVIYPPKNAILKTQKPYYYLGSGLRALYWAKYELHRIKHQNALSSVPLQAPCWFRVLGAKKWKMHPELKQRIGAVDRPKSTPQWASVVKRSLRLKHVFCSILICGQQFEKMKTFRVRKCRYIKRKARGFIKTLEWTVKSLIMNDLTFSADRRFPQSRLKIPKLICWYRKKKTHLAETFQKF